MTKFASVLLLPFLVLAISLEGSGQSLSPTHIGQSIANDTSVPLRAMPLIPPQPRAGVWEKDEIPNRFGFMEGRKRDQSAPEARPGDGRLQSAGGSGTFNVPLVNFDGVANRQGVYPSDPNIDVSATHVIQMTNISFAIYGKSGNLIHGPGDNSTFWQGFTGPWTGTNDGDPIVLYDPLADRWMVSQFSLPTFPDGPFYELVAVSQTADPLGSWHRYAFEFADMPDYPKLGVWPDAYYMSLNVFASGSLGFVGPAAVALDRTAMLAGLPASLVFFQLPSSQAHLLPSDLDGPAPPMGAPNYFMAVEDDAFFGGVDRVEVFEFHVDWTTPANSAFTGPLVLPAASFDMGLCGFLRNCIPQAGSAVKLDAIASLLMYRVQYRNFGTHQTMVTNHTVDANGADQAGIRWYEMRNTGSGWSIYQQGTYAPDVDQRWMGSIAMDGAGSIALGYSKSGTAMFPSIYYTGRLATDPLNTMTLAEQSIVDGSGAQTGSASRWGDYSMMSVDPMDDMTFWYNNQYIETTGGNTWKTRIASFQFSDPTPRAALRYHSTTVSGGNGNSTIDFNECVNLGIILHNTGGAAASGVLASLATSTPGVTVTQSSSTYADISPGGSASNNISFEVSIDPSFVCGTPIPFTLSVAYSGAPAEDLAFVMPSCACPGTTVTGSLASGDPTQTGRLTRNGVPSRCTAAKSCPGLFSASGARYYDTYTYTNTSASPRCVTAELSSDCGTNLFAVAYLGSFNPLSLCANYLADMGTSNTGNAMEFTVPAGSTFVIILHEVTPASGCAGYSLAVSGITCGTDGGGECTPVPIQLASFTGIPIASDRNLLQWTTLSEINNYGFEMQRAGGSGGEFLSIPGSFIPGHGTTIQPHDYSYVDSSASPDLPYYRLKQIDLDGRVHFTDAIRVDVLTTADQDITAHEFSLGQNYPNPFNPSTLITYSLPLPARVTLELFDMLGRRVATLVDGDRTAGVHRVTLEQPQLPSGVYVYRILAGDYRAAKRLVLMK